MIPTRYNKLGADYRSNDIWVVYHSAGVLDINITGASGLLWTFPDNSTSTVNRPLKTVTAGRTIITCNRFNLNGITITTNACTALSSQSINFNTLPLLVYWLEQANDNLFVGDVIRIPRVKFVLSIKGSGIYGTTDNVPRVTYTLSLVSTSVSGNISALPHASTFFQLVSNNSMTGSVSSITWVTGTLVIRGCQYLTGALPIVSTNNNIQFYANPAVSPAEYDQTIANCVSAGGLNKVLTISSRRTSASNADKATLISRGWTINDSQI